MQVTWTFLIGFATIGVGNTGPDKFNLIVPEGPVTARLGSSVTLPCAVSPAFSVVPLKMRWHRPNQFKTPVLLYENRNVQQDPAGTGYRGRVSLVGRLEQGNVALGLKNITPADNGTYQCYVQSTIWYEEASVSLNVEGEVIGTVPLLNASEVDDGQVNVTCTSHGWFPQPTLTWTVGGREKINALNSTVHTTDGQGSRSVSSWQLYFPSESERICCSVGLSDQKRKEGCVVIFAHIEYKYVIIAIIIISGLVLLILILTAVIVCIKVKEKKKLKGERNDLDGGENKPMVKRKDLINNLDAERRMVGRMEQEHSDLLLKVERLEQEKTALLTRAPNFQRSTALFGAEYMNSDLMCKKTQLEQDKKVLINYLDAERQKVGKLERENSELIYNLDEERQKVGKLDRTNSVLYAERQKVGKLERENSDLRRMVTQLEQEKKGLTYNLDEERRKVGKLDGENPDLMRMVTQLEQEKKALSISRAASSQRPPTSYGEATAMANKGTIYGLSAKEYNPVLEELLVSWIKAQCDVDWPRPGKTAFQNWLKDGYVLGILIISLYGVMKPIDRPIKTSIIFQQKNQIGQFLQAAENYGLPKTDLFRIYDLWEGKDLAAVQRTLMALHSLANNRR